jgi:predicted nucleic acid-binding protein
MDAFVLDVSACIPWCCEDETTASSEEMLQWATEGSALHVPSLWTWVILNTVAVVIKRGRITADRGKEFLEQLSTLNFKVENPPLIADFPRLHTLASRSQLTAYDVAYLDLAKRLSLPLATRDSDLARAAVAVGVKSCDLWFRAR